MEVLELAGAGRSHRTGRSGGLAERKWTEFAAGRRLGQ